MTETHPGGCLCGQVRFVAEGPPKWTAWCHCRSCRKHSGQPASAYAGYERDRLRFDREPARFASSEGVQRGFCPTCGSTLSYEGARWPTEVHLHVGAFDDPAPFEPRGQVFTEERVPWFHPFGQG